MADKRSGSNASMEEAVIPATAMRSEPFGLKQKQHVEMVALAQAVRLSPCEGGHCFELVSSTGEDTIVRYRIVDNK